MKNQLKIMVLETGIESVRTLHAHRILVLRVYLFHHSSKNEMAKVYIFSIINKKGRHIVPPLNLC